MAHGALIDPLGANGVALTEDEYKILKNCLQVSRTDNRELQAITQALSVVFDFPDDPPTLSNFLFWLATYYGEPYHPDALLFGMFKRTLHTIQQEGELEALLAFLKVWNTDTWFSKFLTVQVRTVADCQPTPTPLMVMQSLTDYVSEFQQAASTTRQMIKRHPDQFEDLFPKPAASEQPEPPTKRKKAAKA